MSDWLRVVVGVDGSADSQKALRWAYDEARMHGAELLVVGARLLPPSYPPPNSGFEWSAEGAPPARTAEMLDSSVKSVLGEDLPDVRIAVVDGSPSGALIQASRDADLLVVGSRGYGAFAGMLLGSVSLHVATHASCPVVVVR